MITLNTTPAEHLLFLEQRRTEELAYLYQLALDLMAHSDSSVNATCDLVIGSAQLLLNSQSAAILLVDLATGALNIAAQRGNLLWLTVEIADSLLQRNRALAVRTEDGASYVGVRLDTDSDCLGLLIAQRDVGRTPLGDDEIQLITLLAGVTTTTLLNARLRESLTERLDMLQTIMETSSGGLLLVELGSGRLYMANPAALQALHLSNDALGRPLGIDGPGGLLYERLIEALPPAPVSTFDYPLIVGSRTRTIRVHVLPVSADKLLVQLNDVTLLLAVEGRREAAVATASHDLKTPLAVINLGLSNLLAYYEETPDAERRLLIEEALEQVGAMRGSIRSLLHQAQYTPTTQAATGGDEQAAPLDDPLFYMEQVVNELFAFARHQGVQLSWQPPTLPPRRTLHISSSDVDLKTIARNLISNAVKYTPAGGQVQIGVHIESSANSSENSNSMLIFTVRDSGVGIPQDELGAIFRRGYRASTGNLLEGSGLGLSFVKNAVERLGGTIQVESEVGVGSLFTVALPCVLN